jgi:plasmid maintenance system antidote protein VapI
MSLREKLNKIAEKDSSNWLEETSKELAEQDARKKARQLALLVLQLLHQQGMTQTQLAERMRVSRQQVTKIVKGQENFTFETIDKLERALGVTLMTIESPKQATAFERTRVTGTVRVRGEGGRIRGRDTQVGSLRSHSEIGRWASVSSDTAAYHRHREAAEGYWVVSGTIRVKGSELAGHIMPEQEGLDYYNA